MFTSKSSENHLDISASKVDFFEYCDLKSVEQQMANPFSLAIASLGKVWFISLIILTCIGLQTTFYAFLRLAPTKSPDAAPVSMIDFEKFVGLVNNGEDRAVRGVYVPGVFAARVLQQPENEPGAISSIQGIVTEFSLADSYGNIGLLAHSYLAGASFYELMPGQEVRIVYGNNEVEYFIVSDVLVYHALDPYSNQSSFIDLKTGEKVTASTLFHRVYAGNRHVTFQTGIASEGVTAWGRLFVIAVPVNEPTRLIKTEYEKYIDVLINLFHNTVNQPKILAKQ